MSRWTAPQEYLTILPKIRVLLLGSFAPKVKLESIRDGLKQKGITNCQTTKNFNSPLQTEGEPEHLYNLRKSEYWLRRADVFVFVFFKGVDNASVGIELEKTLSQMPGNAWRTILAYEESAPSLVRALGIRFSPDISVVPFSDDVELQKQVCGNIIRMLERFYSSVLIRPIGEWENSSIL